MILLATLLLGGATQATTPAGPPSMTVTADQFAGALAICRDQLARPVPAGDDLVAAGWPKVASQASDGTAPAMVTYRHPQNMLTVTLYDEPVKSDQCIVMTPVGPVLSAADAIKQVTAFAGVKPRDGAWQTDAVTITQEPMGQLGIRIVFTKKGPQ